MENLLANVVQVKKVLGAILEGKSISSGEEIFSPEDYQIVDFKLLSEDAKVIEEYINGTVNAGFLGYSLENGERYAYSRPIYDVKEWQFYIWEYSPFVEETYHMLAYHPQTGRADLLHMTYTSPDNWFIEKSTFLF